MSPIERAALSSARSVSGARARFELRHLRGSFIVRRLGGGRLLFGVLPACELLAVVLRRRCTRRSRSLPAAATDPHELREQLGARTATARAAIEHQRAVGGVSRVTEATFSVLSISCTRCVAPSCCLDEVLETEGLILQSP
jgi:hypothetical protein